MFVNTTSEESIETELARAIAALQFEDIPESAVRTVERAFIDTVGVILAGWREAPTVHSTSLLSSPIADGTVLHALSDFSSRSVPEVGLVLGTAGHALDYDDSSWSVKGHPSTVLVPTVLSLLDEETNGEDAVTAYVAGFETAARVAEPIRTEHFKKGWHATATFGTFGAAGAAAHMLDLDSEQTRNALNIATSMASGIKRNFGSDTKPLHAGLSVRSGITAAILAKQGQTADTRTISGHRGFWELYSEGHTEKPAYEKDWYIREDGLMIKKYPCCRATHSAIAAAQVLRERHDIAPDDIEAVEVVASQNAADILTHEEPSTGLEAKFSIHYTVASALAQDEVNLATFNSNFPDSITEEVRQKITFTVDSELPYLSHTAHVSVTENGETHTKSCVDPWKNDDELVAVSEAELKRKFVECSTRSLETETAERVYSELNRLHEQNGVLTAITTHLD